MEVSVRGSLNSTTIYSNHELFFENPVTFSLATQRQLTSLEQAHGFHFADNFGQNYLGLNESGCRTITAPGSC
jgi:hypothetical protein